MRFDDGTINLDYCRLRIAILVLSFVSAIASPCVCWADNAPKSILLVTYQADGLGREAAVCRRDPSDVIRVGNTYYVWYSKVTEGSPLYPSGYFATLWHATSTDGGRHWQERGEAIGKGDLEAFDSFGVFTPNILFHGRRYYLYFSKDGIRFRMIAATVKGNVHAPGGFRPELTSHTYDQGVRWGISMVHARDPYLVRWSIDVPESLVSNDE